ncbi:DNA polymerase III subunit chi [Rickettsiales endosymbiont of Paramecium tredecaurelia]|uniref:DNA polymerase III subunit chi n=1 Tax=Candidatus Sarmatiella mevalonica TaxID=2770581 RepID=UPI001921F918|nr:DNA polymerase III subunit chi [Candidatus Sarmatiella mevalonica]MBL3284629.1 DNA polymerase III subunit chi [Candidatus Sarmatiella mevalonica]
MNISFYQCHTGQEKTILGLVTKAYQAKIKTLLLTDAVAGRGLDVMLWTTPRTHFLPHATCADPFPERQPVLITWSRMNQNHAECLIVGLDWLFSQYNTPASPQDYKEVEGLTRFLFEFKKIMIVGSHTQTSDYIQRSLRSSGVSYKIYAEQSGGWVSSEANSVCVTV